MTSIVGCVVLAAGGSKRMGVNKLVADLAGKPVVAHAVDAIREAGLPRPIIVLGHEPSAIRAALGERDARFVTTADYRDGMARSLIAGIAAVPDDWVAAIICLADMPLISAKLLGAMAAAAGDSSIILPRFDGRRGNPLLWGRRYFPQLAGLTGDVGGKTLLTEYANAITYLDWIDDSVLVDMDRPEDLQALRRRRAAIL